MPFKSHFGYTFIFCRLFSHLDDVLWCAIQWSFFMKSGVTWLFPSVLILGIFKHKFLSPIVIYSVKTMNDSFAI